jgi:hypothetical protein
VPPRTKVPTRREIEAWRGACMVAVTMPTVTEELAALEAEWQDLADGTSGSGTSSSGPPSSGAFGHENERRLGLRVPAACWALLRDGERSVYAQTVELSPTGVVLKLLDGNTAHFDGEVAVSLDVFVPGADRPIHSAARRVRAIGQLDAFEFLSMNAADRLTLAEHLDRLVAERPPSPASHARKPDSRSVIPPEHWKSFVLSLRPRAKPVPIHRL